MAKITLDVNSFKTLASETRLDILRTLDGKKMSLKEIGAMTNLHEVTIHEHLSKLVEGGFVNKHEREGHKWVYYELSWKGKSLLHPENTRIVILFSFTFLSLFCGVLNIVWFSLYGLVAASKAESSITDKGPTFLPSIQNNQIWIVTVGCFIVFVVLLSISLWRVRKNKTPKM